MRYEGKIVDDCVQRSTWFESNVPESWRLILTDLITHDHSWIQIDSWKVSTNDRHESTNQIMFSSYRCASRGRHLSDNVRFGWHHLPKKKKKPTKMPLQSVGPKQLTVAEKTRFGKKKIVIKSVSCTLYETCVIIFVILFIRNVVSFYSFQVRTRVNVIVNENNKENVRFFRLFRQLVWNDNSFDNPSADRY